MPFSQIHDKLMFNDQVVKASGPLFRPQDLNLNPTLHDNLDRAKHPKVAPNEPIIQEETVKTFTVRVCQTDHTTGMSQNLAEATAPMDVPFSAVFRGDGNWALDLPIIQGSFMPGMDGTATAALVFEAGGDLFTLAWSECVLLVKE
jgi:hypothetical protein